MHAVLICTSVIVQLHSVLSSPKIQDITDRCLSHEQIQFFLTAGIGAFDNKIVMITTEKQLNCRIEFIIMDNNYIIGVIEFPDRRPGKKVCIQEQISEVTVSDFKEASESTCSFKTSAAIYSATKRSRLRIDFQDLHDIPTVKIIATSMRDPGERKCSEDNEVECVLQNRTYCMNSLFSCDGHNNCGVPNSYDENLKNCTGVGLTAYMIFCTIVMHVMTLVLLLSFFYTLLPKRKETFVYRFDQSMPLFDSEHGIVTYDIDVEILLPKEPKALKSTKSILIRK